MGTPGQGALNSALAFSQVGSIHTQYVKIMNVSGSAKRLSIINPTTREFRVRCRQSPLVAWYDVANHQGAFRVVQFIW